MKFSKNLSHLKKQMKKKKTEYLALCLQLPSLMLSFSIMLTLMRCCTTCLGQKRSLLHRHSDAQALPMMYECSLWCHKGPNRFFQATQMGQVKGKGSSVFHWWLHWQAILLKWHVGVFSCSTFRQAQLVPTLCAFILTFPHQLHLHTGRVCKPVMASKLYIYVWITKRVTLKKEAHTSITCFPH